MSWLELLTITKWSQIFCVKLIIYLLNMKIVFYAIYSSMFIFYCTSLFCVWQSLAHVQWPPPNKTFNLCSWYWIAISDKCWYGCFDLIEEYFLFIHPRRYHIPLASQTIFFPPCIIWHNPIHPSYCNTWTLPNYNIPHLLQEAIIHRSSTLY